MQLRTGDTVRIGGKLHTVAGRRCTRPNTIVVDFTSGLSLTTSELALNGAVGRRKR